MLIPKWGSLLAMHLRTAIAEALGRKEGDGLRMPAAGSRDCAVSKSSQAHEVLARLRPFGRRLPAGFRFDRLQSNERDPDPGSL